MLTLGIRLITPGCSLWRPVRLMRRIQPGRKVFGCVRVMPCTLFSEFRGRTQGFRVASIRRADRAGPRTTPSMFAIWDLGVGDGQGGRLFPGGGHGRQTGDDEEGAGHLEPAQPLA